MSTLADASRDATPCIVAPDGSPCPAGYESDSDLDDVLEDTAPTSSFALSRFSSCSKRVSWTSRKLPLAIFSSFFCLFAFSQLYQTFGPEGSASGPERLENSRWIATSHSWLDRNLCRWFGVCGVWHLNRDGWISNGEQHIGRDGNTHNNSDPGKSWNEGTSDPAEWSEAERKLRDLPSYVFDYAPYVHLYSGEKYWPCDIAQHLLHTTPNLNYTPIQASSTHLNLTELDTLNQWGRFVYLKSNDNVEEQPRWLLGKKNIPNMPRSSEENDTAEDTESVHPESFQMMGQELDVEDGLASKNDANDREAAREDLRRSVEAAKQTRAKAGRSGAPAVLVVVDKGNGVVDAFWFFFYSFNQGNMVFNIRFGNHVGDWEHTLVRFRDGKPEAVFLSEHDHGEAYTYNAVEKIGKRPVVYSATGTHAMYATPGTHPYVLPWGLLHDETDRGPLWDPLLNLHAFTYNVANDSLRSSTLSPLAPVGWFYFMGHWGDKYYPLDDPRQYRFAGQYHYVNGPLGPRFKNLGRKWICQGYHGECIIRDELLPPRLRLKRWVGVGEGEEMAEEDVRRLFGPSESEEPQGMSTRTDHID